MAESIERAHPSIWALLPWVVNGTARAADIAAVEQHVAGCAQCREELARQRRLRDLLRRELDAAPAHGPMLEPGLQRLMQRVESASQQATLAQWAGGWRRQGGRRWTTPLMSLALVQAAVIGILAAPMLSGDRGAERSAYQTHSEAAPARHPGAVVRVGFVPTASVQEVQALLRLHGLQAVGGPSVAGLWDLTPVVAGDVPERTVKALRDSGLVLLALPAPLNADGAAAAASR